MLPDIRAVFAAMVAAIGVLIVAFGVVATLRVAQESRAGSLHAELTQRGHATVPEPQPLVLIETPGPTLLAKAPDAEALPAAAEQAPAPVEPPATDKEAPQPATAFPEAPPVASVSAEPDPGDEHLAAFPVPPESLPVVTAEPLPELPAAPAIVAAAPQAIAAWPEAPSPASNLIAIGGPSPEELAQAKAQRKAAERERVRKAAAEKARKARAARIARERKLAAQKQQKQQQKQKQQASASSPQGGFAPAGSFNSAPFGNSFDFGATNRR